MNNIQMVDLAGQYKKIKSEIDHAIEGVLNSTAFINGPEVKKFEKNLSSYTGANHCIACANGTDALQIAMMACGLKEGDEVIVPAFTYIATAEAAALLKLKPVMVDVDPQSFNISPMHVQRAITPRTTAIVPVHLFGQCAEMEQIMILAKENNLFIIEDAAQAIGSEYTFNNGSKSKAGTIGNIGTTSFFPSKNLGCYGDGGAMFTNDDKLANQIRMIANHGQQQKYYHDIIGVNSRLDTLQAALLDVKLKKLNEYSAARQKAASAYDYAFQGHHEIITPHHNPASTHVFHQYTLKIKNGKRDALKSYLQEKGIPSMVYYPVPVHLQKAFSYLHYKKGDFPVSEELCESVLSLPMHTELEEDQLNYIIENVIRFFK